MDGQPHQEKRRDLRKGATPPRGPLLCVKCIERVPLND